MVIYILVFFSIFGNPVIQPYYQSLFEKSNNFVRHLTLGVWYIFQFGLPLVILIILYKDWEFTKGNIFFVGYTFSILISRFDLFFMVKLYATSMESSSHLLYQQIKIAKKLNKMSGKKEEKIEIEIPFINKKLS